DGGMGLLGGVFIPDDSNEWPSANASDELYQVDRLHYLREVRGSYEMIADSEVPSHSDADSEAKSATHQHSEDPVEHAH
ncbi:MAG: hypothetical protein KJO98_11525, partial [Rhodothermia bacterium]|nr:hypothetical protein [Rhodothermia bacterium]